MSPPWMPLYIADYLADTAHLSAAESGAYLHLIMQYWQNGGSIPDDDKQLARIARMTAVQWRAAKPVLQAFFHDGWKHKRIDKELSEANEKIGKRISAGKAGGIASAEARRTSSNRSTDASSNRSTDVTANVHQPPSPLRKKDAAVAAPELPLPDEETELFRRGKQVLGKEAGGMVAKLLKAKGGKTPLARAAIEMAATKSDPREYIGAIIRGKETDASDWRSAII